MTNQLLNTYSVAPKSGNTPKQLVIFLHGLGSDGKDLISLSQEFADSLPDAQFISPDAPFPCDMAPYGYQWFSLQNRDPKILYDEVSNNAAPILNQYIDEMLQHFNLTDDKLILIGFSQGTMTALHVALNRDKKCAGILGYSGALLNYNPLENQVTSKPNICLIHGKNDDVVPFTAMNIAKEELSKMGINAQTHGINNLSHGINEQAINIGNNFLQKLK